MAWPWALILDATLIRLVILPSTLSLLGQRSWFLPGGWTGCRTSR